MKKIIFVSGLLLISCCTAGVAQTLTVDQILENVKGRFDEVHDYTVTVTANVEVQKLNVPEMKIKLYFKQPDKIHIESNGFAMVPREAVRFNPSRLLDDFDATLLGSELEGDTILYKVRLVSKEENAKPPRETMIWIDGTRWVVVKMETTPAEGREIEVQFFYEKVDNEYLLPSRIFVQFDFHQELDSSAERMYGPQRVPRKGSVDIMYSDYLVNSGLSDDLFKKEGTESK